MEELLHEQHAAVDLGGGLELAFIKTQRGLWSVQAHKAIRSELLAPFPIAKRAARAR